MDSTHLPYFDYLVQGVFLTAPPHLLCKMTKTCSANHSLCLRLDLRLRLRLRLLDGSAMSPRPSDQLSERSHMSETALSVTNKMPGI